MMHATYSTHKVSLLCYLHINCSTVLATNCHKYNHMSYIILSLSTCQYAIANLLPNMNLQSIIYYIFLRNRSHKYLWQVPGSCEPLTQICNYLCLSEIWICGSQYPQVFTWINSQVPTGLWYSCPPLVWHQQNRRCVPLPDTVWQCYPKFPQLAGASKDLTRWSNFCEGRQ